MVLEGAVTQRKRSGAASLERPPPSASPATILRVVSRCAPTASRSRSGCSAASAAVWRAPTSIRASRNDLVRQNTTTPTFTPSPRSTRGTTRRTAYSNGSGGMPQLLDRLDEGFARAGPGQQVANVGVALRRGVSGAGVGEQPSLRGQGDDLLQQRRRDARGQPIVGALERRGKREHHAVGDCRQGPSAALVGIAPR